MSDLEPDNIVEAIARLRELGFDGDLDVRDEKLMIRSDDGFAEFTGTQVDHVFRFEGPTNPADESIVLGISGGDAGAKGVLVSTYGPESEDGHDVVLATLDLGDRWR